MRESHTSAYFITRSSVAQAASFVAHNAEVRARHVTGTRFPKGFSMKRGRKIALVVVLVIIVAGAAYGGYAYYSIVLFNNGGNSCVSYLRTDCGGDHNVISYDKATGDITVGSVGQSFGETWYNVAVAYTSGNPVEPTAAYFTQDSADFPGNTLNSGQHVTIHDLNATGPAVAGMVYNGSLWIAYTTTSGGSSCAGAYNSVQGCQYTEIGTITLQGKPF